MKNDNLFPPKITNSTVMAPNEDYPNKIPGTQLKKIINILNQLEEDTNTFKGKHKKLEEIRKSVSSMKIEFNKKKY